MPAQSVANMLNLHRTCERMPMLVTEDKVDLKNGYSQRYVNRSTSSFFWVNNFLQG